MPDIVTVLDKEIFVHYRFVSKSSMNLVLTKLAVLDKDVSLEREVSHKNVMLSLLNDTTVCNLNQRAKTEQSHIKYPPGTRCT